MIDAFDSAHERRAFQLATLHEQLEVQRASGAHDAASFIAAVRRFDSSLSDTAAASLYIDCDLASAEERAKDRGGGSAASDAVPLAVFVRLCEEHGVTHTAD